MKYRNKMKYHKISWSKEQQKSLRNALKNQEEGKSIVAYIITDPYGYFPNKYLLCEPFAVFKVNKKCSKYIIQGTFKPYKYKCHRIWVVEFKKPFKIRGDKIKAKECLVIGEILPTDCISYQIGIKMGIKDIFLSNLSHANLDNTDLKNANFIYVDLNNASLINANFTNVNFKHTILNKVKFDDAKLEESNFESVESYDGSFEDVNLKNSFITHSIFNNSRFVNSNFAGITIEDSKFKNTNFTNSNFSYADFYNVDFTESNLVNANFNVAFLKNVNFTEANLKNADFTEADLEGVNFEYANLEGVKFDNAEFKNCNFHEAYRPEDDLHDLGWETDNDGYLRRMK